MLARVRESAPLEWKIAQEEPHEYVKADKGHNSNADLWGKKNK